jgi:hypothetical protein
MGRLLPVFESAAFIPWSVSMLVLQAELTRAREVENVATLGSAHEDAEGLVQMVALLEGELAEVHRARETVEDLSLQRARVSELCLAIVDPPRVRNHLSERMQAAALCHTKGAEKLVALRAAVSSAM